MPRPISAKVTQLQQPGLFGAEISRRGIEVDLPILNLHRTVVRQVEHTTDRPRLGWLRARVASAWIPR